MTTKKCYTCKQDLPLSQFNKNSAQKDGLQTICKDCSKKKSREYYSENRESHKETTSARKKKAKEENRKHLYQYFMEHPCVDCGEKDIRCLEFDHVRGTKTANVSSMVRNVCSWETILKEIEKCDVRCASCHRKKTADDQSWYRSLMGL